MMRHETIRRPLAGLIAVGGVFLTAACQAGPPKYTAEPAETAIEPVSVAQNMKEQRINGARINPLGGEIPEAKPATPIGDEGMGEVH